MNENRPKPDVTPFNHDIARTIFAPLFFSLHHYQNKEQSSSTIRHHLERPSPFVDHSCAQTAERMLHRMMENRYRSDGRTVCPDGRTFGLVAGAFGRLRCGSVGSRQSTRRKMDRKIVTWEEELNINPQYRNVTYKSEGGQSKIQVTPIDKLQELLQLQLQLCHREGWPAEILPSVDMYNRVLKRLAWQSGTFRTQKHDNEISAAEQAWLWLQFMKSRLPQNHITDEESGVLCHPDAMSYAHVIDALSSHREYLPSESGKMNSSSLMNRPEVAAFDSIDTLANQLDVEMRSRTDLSPNRFRTEAEALLSVLENEYSKLNKTTVIENGSDHGRSKEKLERAMARAYKCLVEGWGRYAVAGVSIDSDGSNTEKVVDDEREHAVKRAHKLLCRLEALSSSSMSHATIVPSSCYSSVILALSISKKPSSAIVAEGVLQRMMSQFGIDHPSGFNQEAFPSSFFNANDVATAFSGCIAAHAKNNDAPKAEKILYQMLDLYHDGKLGADFVPEVRALGTCIALWGKYDPANRPTHSSSRQIPNERLKKDLPSHQQRLLNADNAAAILSELESVAEVEVDKGNENFALHATPYNIAILARVQTIDGDSRSSSKYNKYNNDNEENEQIILHAQSILDHMEYTMGITPDPYTYSILLHAWCQQSRPGNEKAADYAEELLRRRIEDVDISKITGDDLAASSSREPAQSEIWPNVKHYSSVLKAHAKTKSAGGAKKSLALLSEMEQRFYDAKIIDDIDSSDTDYHVDQKDVAKPDLVCYSIVIDAFANSRLPEEASSVAHRLLRAVETKYEAGDVSMKPNTRIYTAVILSLVHSPLIDGDASGKHINNAKRAWSILERMKENNAPPNSYTYNYIINCAAQAGDDIEDQKISFEIALRAFQELRKASTAEPSANGCMVNQCHPDSFTFAFMLKACKNLLPAGSLCDKVMSQTVQECCRSGYLNDAVLDRLWMGVSEEKFYDLLDEKLPAYNNNNYQNKSPIQANDLPVSWSRCCNSWKSPTGKRVDNNFNKMTRKK